MSPERGIYWENQKALIVSDTHIGKTGHFRKSGIAVPQRVYTEDLQRLLSLILYFKAEQLIVVGDLSHSRSNRELELFRRWRADFPSLHICLVKGNHDILDDQWYRDTEIQVHQDTLVLNGFRFRHEEPADTDPEAAFQFCGHIHPGVSVRGMGKQALRFPCFYFSGNTCILPAFSRFTGLASVPRQADDKIFAIVGDSLMRIQ